MNSLDICLASSCVIQWFLGIRASFFNTTQLIMLALYHEDAIKLNFQSLINFVMVCPHCGRQGFGCKSYVGVTTW